MLDLLILFNHAVKVKNIGREFYLHTLRGDFHQYSLHNVDKFMKTFNIYIHFFQYSFYSFIKQKLGNQLVSNIQLWTSELCRAEDEIMSTNSFDLKNSLDKIIGRKPSETNENNPKPDDLTFTIIFDFQLKSDDRLDPNLMIDNHLFHAAFS